MPLPTEAAPTPNCTEKLSNEAAEADYKNEHAKESETNEVKDSVCAEKEPLKSCPVLPVTDKIPDVNQVSLPADALTSSFGVKSVSVQIAALEPPMDMSKDTPFTSSCGASISSLPQNFTFSPPTQQSTEKANTSMPPPFNFSLDTPVPFKFSLPDASSSTSLAFPFKSKDSFKTSELDGFKSTPLQPTQPTAFQFSAPSAGTQLFSTPTALNSVTGSFGKQLASVLP